MTTYFLKYHIMIKIYYLYIAYSDPCMYYNWKCFFHIKTSSLFILTLPLALHMSVNDYKNDTVLLCSHCMGNLRQIRILWVL